MASSKTGTATLGPLEIDSTLKSEYKVACTENKSTITKETVGMVEKYVKVHKDRKKRGTSDVDS